MKKRMCTVLLLMGALIAGSLSGCAGSRDTDPSSIVSGEDTKSSNSQNDETKASTVTVAAIMESKEERMEEEKKHLNLRIKLIASNQVRLTWDPIPGTKKYIIERTDENRKNKKVFKVSSNVTYFQDTMERDKYYYYALENRRKKGEEYDRYETATAYTGVLVPWGEEWHYGTLAQETGWTNATRITIFNRCVKGSKDAGIMPDGVEIYRGDTPDSCRYLGEMKYCKSADREYAECDYVDEDVVPGQVYYYKRRNYKETAQGRVYSLFSKTVRLQALSSYGNYRMWLVKKEKKKGKKDGKEKVYLKSLTMAIHNSSVGNGDLKTDTKCTYSGLRNTKYLKVVKYSFDGINWTDLPKKEQVMVHPEQTIYLKMIPKGKISYSSLKTANLVYYMYRVHTTGKMAEFKYYFSKESLEGGEKLEGYSD